MRLFTIFFNSLWPSLQKYSINFNKMEKGARNEILFVGASRCTLQTLRSRANRFVEMESHYYRKYFDLGDGSSLFRLHPLLGRFRATLDAR